LVVYIIYTRISLHFLRLAKQSQFIPLQNVVYFISLSFLVCKIFTYYINDVLLFKCPIPGQRGNSQITAQRILCILWTLKDIKSNILFLQIKHGITVIDRKAFATLNEVAMDCSQNIIFS